VNGISFGQPSGTIPEIVPEYEKSSSALLVCRQNF